MATTPPFSTAFTSLLGIDHPIALAGMGLGITTPELVAAVSNAGGIGILGASAMPADDLVSAIAAIRSLTSKPFGVNWVVAPESGTPSGPDRLLTIMNGYRSELGLEAANGLPEGSSDPSEECIETALELRVPLLSFGLSDSSQFVERAHSRGARVMTMVATVEEARISANSGSDLIVAQGYEAGGHRSNFQYSRLDETPMIGTLALVPQVADAVSVPVIAAGGIMDGRGLAAALSLGASGVLMGTRFLTAQESGIFPTYLEAVLNADETVPGVSDAPTGRPARSIRNRLTTELGKAALQWPQQFEACWDVYERAWETNRSDLYPLWAGQGVGMATKVQPASEIVAEVVEEAHDIIQSMALAAGRVG